MKNIQFNTEVLETKTRGNHYMISCKYNERFDCFIIRIKTNGKVSPENIDTKISEIKTEVTKDIEDGYSKRRINIEYKF